MVVVVVVLAGVGVVIVTVLVIRGDLLVVVVVVVVVVDVVVVVVSPNSHMLPTCCHPFGQTQIVSSFSLTIEPLLQVQSPSFSVAPGPEHLTQGATVFVSTSVFSK